MEQYGCCCQVGKTSLHFWSLLTSDQCMKWWFEIWCKKRLEWPLMEQRVSGEARYLMIRQSVFSFLRHKMSLLPAGSGSTEDSLRRCDGQGCSCDWSRRQLLRFHLRDSYRGVNIITLNISFALHPDWFGTQTVRKETMTGGCRAKLLPSQARFVIWLLISACVVLNAPSCVSFLHVLHRSVMLRGE